jgi:GAF domain-containing protein/HAMP domain-containing protein
MVVAMLVALVALAMSQAISNPIVHLRDFANQVASGNLQVQAQVHSRDETGQLANAFNDMTSQLRKSFEDLDRRAKEVTTVADVSRRLSSILDQHQLVSEVVEQLQSAFNYYHAHIYLFDETGENLVMAGGTGEVGKALLERRHKIPRGRGLVGRAAETKEAVLVPDTSNDPNWLPNPLLPETRSEVAVPILAGDHVLGVLDVQNNAVDSLRQQDSDLILSIANQIAVAIQNIRLYEETRNAEMAVTRRANELELASRVATATATILDSDKLLQEVVDLTKQTFRLYHAHIYLLNEAGDTLELTSGAGEVGRQMVAEGRQIPLNREQSLVARAARERRGFYVNDVRSDPHFLPHPLLPETRSELAVPMIIGDKVIGVFDVQSDAVDYFTDEAVRIQTTLAAQVSIALQNARSLISAKRRAEREAALNVIGQKIQGATSVEAVLQIAARELGRALGAPLTVAQLGIKSPGRNGDDHR